MYVEILEYLEKVVSDITGLDSISTSRSGVYGAQIHETTSSVQFASETYVDPPYSKFVNHENKTVKKARFLKTLSFNVGFHAPTFVVAELFTEELLRHLPDSFSLGSTQGNIIVGDVTHAVDDDGSSSITTVVEFQSLLYSDSRRLQTADLTPFIDLSIENTQKK